MRLLRVLILVFLMAPALQADGSRVQQIKKDFHEAWRYYKWRIAIGDSLVNLEYLLVRIHLKFADAPVNLAKLNRELDAIRRLKSSLPSKIKAP